MMWNCERTGEDVFKCPCTVVSLKLVYVCPYVEDLHEHSCVFEYIDLSTKISFWFQLVCTLANSKYANVINYISRLVKHIRMQPKSVYCSSEHSSNTSLGHPETTSSSQSSASTHTIGWLLRGIGIHGIHWIQSVIQAQASVGLMVGNRGSGLTTSLRAPGGGARRAVCPGRSPPLMESLLSLRSRPAPWAPGAGGGPWPPGGAGWGWVPTGPAVAIPPLESSAWTPL